MSNRRTFLKHAATAACCWPLSAVAARSSLAQLTATVALASTDYQIVTTPAELPAAGDTIRITEFFNYSCPACHAWYPKVEEWLDDKPDYVDWERTPLVFARHAGIYARTHYVLEAFNRRDLADEVFRAIHTERKLLNSEERIAAWLAEEHGIDEEKALKAFDSFSVSTKVKRGTRRAEQFEINTTPTFLIADRYLLVPSTSNSPAKLFRTMTELVEAIHAGNAPN